MSGRIAGMMKVKISRFCGAVPITVDLIAAAAPVAAVATQMTGATVVGFVAPGLYKTLPFAAEGGR